MELQTLPAQSPQNVSSKIWKVCIICRPGPANPTRHMSEVENEQAMIIGLVTDDANTLASAIRRNIGVVDADVDLIIVRVDEARALSSGLINVLTLQ